MPVRRAAIAMVANNPATVIHCLGRGGISYQRPRMAVMMRRFEGADRKHPPGKYRTVPVIRVTPVGPTVGHSRNPATLGLPTRLLQVPLVRQSRDPSQVVLMEGVRMPRRYLTTLGTWVATVLRIGEVGNWAVLL
jgi:hypothetical protein